jgi:putative nucleotidyltransferase with HDIG domain
MGELPQRETALALLNEYTQKPGLIKHALAVEAAVRAYAEKHGEDPHAWGLVGLLHDFDYERWPSQEDHPFRGCEILEQQGYPDWFRRAVKSHAAYTGVARESLLEKTLFACDELCGFLTACANQ